MPRNPKDTVRLVMGGRELTGWTGATIDMAIDQIADAFSLTMPFDPLRPADREVFRPFGYQPVKLYIGDDLLLTGRAERWEPGIDERGRTITVQGRSLPGALVDCAIEGELERSGLALSTICKVIAQPFGVTVRADNDTDPLEVARATYGQRAADFLMSLAKPRRLYLNSSYDGQLVISWANTLLSRPVVASLREGEHPLLSVSVAFDGTARFSRYTASTQYAGEIDISGTVTDSTVPVYRPQVEPVRESVIERREGESSDISPAVTAAQMRNDAVAASVQIAASVSGWRRPDGLRWAERQMITLQAPGAMLYRERKYLIAGASFRLDAATGETVMLRLVFPEVLAGKLPEVIPWAE